MAETCRAQSAHLEIDRRLGCKREAWEGRPLLTRRSFDASPAFFLGRSTAPPAPTGTSGLFLYIANPGVIPIRHSQPSRSCDRGMTSRLPDRAAAIPVFDLTTTLPRESGFDLRQLGRVGKGRRSVSECDSNL